MWLGNDHIKIREAQMSSFRELTENEKLTRVIFCGNESSTSTTPHMMGARLALTLSGCHETVVHQKGQNKMMRSHPGEAYYFAHGVSNTNTDSTAREVVTFIFKRDNIDMNFIWHDGDPNSPTMLNIFRIPQPLNDIGMNLLSLLHKVYAQPQPNHRDVLLLRTLLITLMNMIDSPVEMKSSKANITWARIHAHLTENLHLDLNRDKIATQFKLSRNYVSTLCLRQTGTAFNQLLTDMKLQRATGLLKDHSLSISEVSYRCGFEDSSYFARRFKSQKGITPLQYRKQFHQF
jgi:AraC-like DNA-binding protein